MPRPIARWLQHAAFIGLVAVAASVGASQQVVQLREASPAVAQALTSQTADPTIGEAHQ